MMRAYTVRYSARAKHLSFQVHPHRGLEVVVPEKFPPNEIPRMLEKHQDWIENTMKKVQSNLRPPEPDYPKRLHFQATRETWLVNYKEDLSIAGLTYHINSHEKKICLRGKIKSKKLCYKALQLFTAEHAKDKLLAWLDRLSVTHNLPYKEGKIRRARSHWGSCNISKNISLNPNLLFLPTALVEYVILHELCHTKHLNHSARFWNYLAEFNPECLQRRDQLRKADQYLPTWVFESS